MPPVRIRRDRVPFTCPNCMTRVYSRPDNKLVCGQCFIPLVAQLPPYYPQALEQVRPNPTKTPPAELPLEDLALPPHVRELLDSITETVPTAEPAPVELAVVRQPEQEEKKPTRKPALSKEILAEADRIITNCLKADAEKGAKRSGWKQQLAQKLGRHPAWVSGRIKKLQAESQKVAA